MNFQAFYYKMKTYKFLIAFHLLCITYKALKLYEPDDELQMMDLPLARPSLTLGPCIEI